MPELPEVETVCRGLSQMIGGKILADLMTRRTHLRQKIPPNLAENIQGKQLYAVSRRAKYILLHFAPPTNILSILPANPTLARQTTQNIFPHNSVTLIIHLGMSGRILVDFPNLDSDVPNPPHKHDHVELIFTDASRMIFNDPRRFGLLDFSPTTDLATHPLLAHLGIEPLENDFTVDYLAKILHGKKTPIKSVLLDQTYVVGLGNIYICEALHQAHILPHRQAATLNPAEIKLLHHAIQEILQAAIAAGGSSWRDYAKPDGDLGYFQTMTKVYGRENEKCLSLNALTQTPLGQKPSAIECTGIILRQIQSGRSSFFCPICQK